ncbi:unnamed protein product, partial [Allacma fusca]
MLCFLDRKAWDGLEEDDGGG